MLEDAAGNVDGDGDSSDDLSTRIDLVELSVVGATQHASGAPILLSSSPSASAPVNVIHSNRDDDLSSLSSGSGCNRSSREMRNLAEKKRRDTLNTHINVLSTLVPMVSGASKKLDKTSILRLSATYLRMHKTLKADKNWPHLPKLLRNINLSQYLMEDMEGFLLITTASGRIIFISHTVERYLGHSQHELLGQSLHMLVHEDDRDELRRQLTPDEGFNGCFPSPDGSVGHLAPGGDDSSSSDSMTSCSSGRSSPGPSSGHHYPGRTASATTSASLSADAVSSSTTDPDPPMNRQRRSFYASSRADHGQYELVHVIGDLRVPVVHRSEHLPFSHTRTRRQKDCRYNEGDIVLVAVGRMHRERSVRELCILEPTLEEYITRHEPSGTMTYIDHRISITSGYMAEEVLGLSAFNFMHKEDVVWTMIALKKMYDDGDGFGTSVYRLLAKNGEYIYMRTCGYLEFDQNSQTIASFICVNTLISKEEGEKGIKELRERLSAKYSGAAEALIALAARANGVDQICESLLQRSSEQQRMLVSSTTSPTQHVALEHSHQMRPTVLREVFEVSSMGGVTSSTGAVQSCDSKSRKRKFDDSDHFGGFEWEDTSLQLVSNLPQPNKGNKPSGKQQELEHMMRKNRGLNNVSV